MGTRKKQGIVAIFEYLDDTMTAVDKIRESLRSGDTSFKNFELFSPTSYHEIVEREEEVLGPSPVRWFTFVGAVTGCFSGFGLALACDYNWPIVVGGKIAGIDSVIAYFVFGFELMILLGAIATIVGMLVMGRIPNRHAQILDTRITNDRFAIFVPEASVDSRQAGVLKDCGAEEIFSA